VLIELAVLFVCIYSGFGIGKPSSDSQTEDALRQMRKPYLWLWYGIALSGVLMAFSIADFTMITIAIGLLIGFLASRR